MLLKMAQLPNVFSLSLSLSLLFCYTKNLKLWVVLAVKYEMAMNFQARRGLMGTDHSGPGFPHGNFLNYHQIKLSSHQKPHVTCFHNLPVVESEKHPPQTVLFTLETQQRLIGERSPLLCNLDLTCFHSQAWLRCLAFLCGLGSDFRTY